MLKIVIAEDEDVIRDGLITYIDWNSIGYEFAGEASNGKEAFQIIDRVKPDVLLTDIKMPFMDGLTLIEETKKKYPDLYYIILSGHDEFEYARRALKAGVYEFVLKPINVTNLKEILIKVKAEHEKRQSARDELKKLKEMEQENKLQIRKKIFHEILIDHITVTKPQESLLRKELDDNYFIAGVIEMQNLAMRSMDSDFLELIETDLEFGHRVDKFLFRIKDSFLFKSGNCERILCLEASNPKLLEDRMLQISNNLRKNQDELFSIVLSYGKIHKGLKGLKQSHIEARVTQEKTNVKAWTNVLYPESQDSKPLNFTDFDTKALTTEVQTGTKDGIDAELQILENTLKIKGMTSHMLVIMVISDIFFQLAKLPEGIEGYSNEILENPMHYYQKIIQQKDITGIFYYLKKICYSINDFFTDVYSGKFDNVLKRALDYIDTNYANEDLMIKDVAQYAYVSSSYLSIILKKEMGITFIEYLTKVRMEHAKKLLEETQMKHYEIAEACGYSNSTYFSTIFKRFYGVSPSGFLNKTKEHSK